MSIEVKQVAPYPASSTTGHSAAFLSPSSYSDSPPCPPTSSYAGPTTQYHPGSVTVASSSDTGLSVSAAHSITTLLVANVTPQSTAGLTIGQCKALEAGLRMVPGTTGVQHADSGIRFNTSDEPEASGSGSGRTDAPPVYTAD